MIAFLEKFKIQLAVGVVTVGLSFYLGYLLGQFAIAAYIIYLLLFWAFSSVARKIAPSRIFIYIAHLAALLVAGAFFAYVVYGFAMIGSSAGGWLL